MPLKKSYKLIYYSFSIFFGISIILNWNDWKLAGYFTDKIIAWIWIFLTLFFIIIFWKKKYVKIYFFSIVALLSLSVLPMAIPLFGIYFYLTKEGDYQQIEMNNNFRLERTKQQALSLPRIYIYEKYFGILEKNISRPNYSEILQEMFKDSNLNEKETNIQSAKFISKNNDSIGIEYEILNTKKTIYHKLNNEDGY
ncbi:hypothetical protein H1R17_07340 [Flavobacterium sp. xlx-214]|uniref:hypothetical protein n=1 Tax=unclassified Flavobacterium TaxID=196869 RepID=UPI0013D51935|nr:MULTISPECIES: hypothetical protein [unclassified Flavobacterium]MBA5792527.1 hypothetical protein [Flavobacterium sp. xlx-221]QMI82321.1 hypothetical protein H1R17_07340 [Flavobacterium sp. xlx-214]